MEALPYTKKELFHKPVIATPRLSLLHEQQPFSTLSQLARPPSLTPFAKAKKKLLITVLNHVITMAKFNSAVGNVSGSIKQCRAFRVSIE